MHARQTGKSAKGPDPVEKRDISPHQRRDVFAGVVDVAVLREGSWLAYAVRDLEVGESANRLRPRFQLVQLRLDVTTYD